MAIIVTVEGKSTLLNMIMALPPLCRSACGRWKGPFKLTESELINTREIPSASFGRTTPKRSVPNSMANVQLPMHFSNTKIPYDESAKIQLSNNQKTHTAAWIQGMSIERTVLSQLFMANNSVSLSHSHLQTIRKFFLQTSQRVQLTKTATSFWMSSVTDRRTGTTIIIVNMMNALQKSMSCCHQRGKTSSEFIVTATPTSSQAYQALMTMGDPNGMQFLMSRRFRYLQPPEAIGRRKQS